MASYDNKADTGGGGGGSAKSSNTVPEGGGFRYEFKGRTYTYQVRNGEIWKATDLSDIPQKVPYNQTAEQVITRLKEKGYEVTILSPEQMQARVDARNADRAARANIDYELGAGVPWGNKNNRRAARQGHMISRAQKRR
jgi:hypothetical protein